MASPKSIINIAGDYEETLLRLANHLGQNQVRRKVFNVIYGRGRLPKSPKQILEKAKLVDSQMQQVHNALNTLSKHNLIHKVENERHVDDGSRYLYGKVEAVRANKELILRYADNPTKAKDLPTKRRPHPQGSPPRIAIPRTSRKKSRLNVLYLTANPRGDAHLQVGREVRYVQDAVRKSSYRDRVHLHYRPAADLDSLLNGLNEIKPQLVHFSGHGDADGVSMDNHSRETPDFVELGYDLFKRALGATDSRPKVVVLNSCYGSLGSQELLESVDVLIAMNDSISDIAALTFAPSFYGALASGQSVSSAFQQGCLAVEFSSLGESTVPSLHAVPGLALKSLVLV